MRLCNKFFLVFNKQAFTNLSKMQLMERNATGVLVVFLVIMNGECFLVIELGTDVFHVGTLSICSTYNRSSNVRTSGIGLKVLKLSFMAGSSARNV